MGLIIGVALLGGAASVVRFGVSRIVPGPGGTFIVNITGSLALGILHAADVTGTAYTLFGTAVIGSYTTFSTWMLETSELPPARALANLGIPLATGLVAVALPSLV